MLRRVLIGLGFLFSVVLVGAFTVPLFIDWTDFREDFERQATLIVGKKIAVKGGIKIHILPFPSVFFKDIRIDQKEDGSFESKIEGLSMRAEFLPLLSGEIRVFDMYIDQPHLNFYLSSKGVSNWFQRKSAMDMIHNVILEKIHVKGGRIKIIDQESDQVYFLSDLNLQISARFLNIISPLSIDSIKGSVIAEGTGNFDNKRSAFKITANFPAKNKAISLKIQLFPLAYPIIIDLFGNLFWNEKQPIYSGVFSVAGDFSKLLNLELSAKKSRLSGNFKISDGNVRISRYKLQSILPNSSTDEDNKTKVSQDEENLLNFSENGAESMHDLNETDFFEEEEKKNKNDDLKKDDIQYSVNKKEEKDNSHDKENQENFSGDKMIL